jgi:hypothetical protein
VVAGAFLLWIEFREENNDDLLIYVNICLQIVIGNANTLDLCYVNVTPRIASGCDHGVCHEWNPCCKKGEPRSSSKPRT